MSQESSISTLSKRASAVAKPSPSTLIWEVLRDQWHPDRNPNGYVSVGVAENRLMHKELAQRVAKVPPLSEHAFTYGDGPFGSHRLRSAMARFLNEHMEPISPLSREDMIITNGVSHSIEHTSWAFLNPGDGFLLGRPYYGAFIADIELRPEAKVVPVDFGDVDPLGIEAVTKYEKAFLDARKRGITVKALMLCSPHNPLGRCYPREALAAYLKLCSKYQLHFVSDEIYALSVWDNPDSKNFVPFTSVLAIDLKGLINADLVHVLWGVSKDFGANGVRLGCIITRNKAFREAMNSVAIYSYVSGFSDHVVSHILEDAEWTDCYIKTNRARLSSSYTFVVDWLRAHDFKFTLGSNAAFFVWIDLGTAYLAKHPDRKGSHDITSDIMQALLKQKLYLANGQVFGSEKPGVFRLVFSHPTSYVKEALERMLKAIEVGAGDGGMAKL